MRLFVAIEISDEIKEELEKVQRVIRKASSYSISFSKPSQFHITVKFLDEVADEKIDTFKKGLQAVSSQIKPFAFKLESFECFPLHGPLKLIWMTPKEEQTGTGFENCRKVWSELMQGIDTWTETVPYVPHVTLARVQRDNKFQQQIREALSKFNSPGIIQTVSSLALLASEKTLAGATHTKLFSATLGG